MANETQTAKPEAVKPENPAAQAALELAAKDYKRNRGGSLERAAFASLKTAWDGASVAQRLAVDANIGVNMVNGASRGKAVQAALDALASALIDASDSVGFRDGIIGRDVELRGPLTIDGDGVAHIAADVHIVGNSLKLNREAATVASPGDAALALMAGRKVKRSDLLAVLIDAATASTG